VNDIRARSIASKLRAGWCYVSELAQRQAQINRRISAADATQDNRTMHEPSNRGGAVAGLSCLALTLTLAIGLEAGCGGAQSPAAATDLSAAPRVVVIHVGKMMKSKSGAT